MRSLENSATIYVPTETEEGQKIAVQIADQAAREFGGSTMSGAVGRYMDGKQMDTETITLITVSAQQGDRAKFAAFLHEAARAIGRNLNQKEVAIMLHGSMGGYLGFWEAGKDYFLDKEVSGE